MSGGDALRWFLEADPPEPLEFVTPWELLHQEHPESWPVTDEERAEWIGARVRVNASNRPEHPWAGQLGHVVGVWRGLGFAGVWHVLTDGGDQFGAFTGELDRV